MIVIIGLVILVAAVIAGVAGVLANSGSAHALTHGFALFGYHVTGSTGTLFLYGIVVGALGFFGLSLLLAGARRTSRRGRAARRGLKQSRQETAAASQARDDLIDERETASASAAVAPGNGTAEGAPRPLPGDARWHMPHLSWKRPAAPGGSTTPDPVAGQPTGENAADSPRPAGSAVNGSRS
jgi:hypothetical protein